jgi:hypothetical protein
MYITPKVIIDITPRSRKHEKGLPPSRRSTRRREIGIETEPAELPQLWIVEGEGLLDLGEAYPGILLPVLANLFPILDGFFSPFNDQQNFPLLHDMSPV